MRRPVRAACAPLLGLLASACLVGPDYQRPSAPAAPAFKEAQGWTPAHPADAVDRGDWWTIYGDPVLDGLERQVALSNQTVAGFAATYGQARQITAEARASFFPTLDANFSATHSKSANGTFTTTSPAAATGAGGTVVSTGSNPITTYTANLQASWAPDLWGRIRRQVESDRAAAQADAADTANARLSAEGELASDYFQLRASDAQARLLRDTVADYRRYLTLTDNQYRAGTQSRAALLSAQTQLLGAQASLTDIATNRAALEHAIAVLTGAPPAALSLAPVDALRLEVPVAPAGLPSTLLQRRPDIAAAERRVASANALIGVQKAAFYPDITLSGTEGFESTAFSRLFSAATNFWSVGGTAAEEILDFGARRAAVRAASYARDAAVANYRQTVLTAFQGVEDELSTLHVLQGEIAQREATERAARQAYQITLNEYRAGVVDYTAVITAAAILYTDAQATIAVQGQRLQASALLIQNLGGGWRTADLPRDCGLLAKDRTAGTGVNAVLSASAWPRRRPAPSPGTSPPPAGRGSHS